MIGTPNHGTELFELGHTPVIGRMLWFLYGAAQADDEITPHSDFLNELGYAGRPNYFTIAGTVPQGPLVIPAITKRVLSGNNDGAVTTISVRLGEPSRHFECRLDHSELIKDRGLYERLIRNILTDQPIGYEPSLKEVRANDVQKQDVYTQLGPSSANGKDSRRRLQHLIPNLLVNLARVRTPPEFSQDRAVI